MAERSKADQAHSQATGYVLLGILLIGATIWAYAAHGMWGTAAAVWAVWMFALAGRGYRKARELRQAQDAR